MNYSALPIASETHSGYEYEPVILRKSSGARDTSFFAVQNTVGKFEGLKYLRDNWDGRGSLAPRASSIESADMALKPIAHGAALTGYKWVEPHVSCSEDGTVVLEWWAAGGKKLTLYVYESWIEYVKVWGANIDIEMEDGKLSGGVRFSDLWSWLSA